MSEKPADVVKNRRGLLWNWQFCDLTSDVSFLLDRLQRGTLHQELHQLGPDPFGVRVPRRAGGMCDALSGGWKVSDIYRRAGCAFQLGQTGWRHPGNLHRRLSATPPERSSRAAASLEAIFSYRSPSSSSEGWSWYSWGTDAPSVNTINTSLQINLTWWA